jgi:hypothetical protein
VHNSRVIEEAHLLGYDLCLRAKVPDVSKENYAFLLIGQKLWSTLPLRTKAILSFETSGTIHSTTQPHIREDLNNSCLNGSYLMVVVFIISSNMNSRHKGVSKNSFLKTSSSSRHAGHQGGDCETRLVGCNQV